MPAYSPRHTAAVPSESIQQRNPGSAPKPAPMSSVLPFTYVRPDRFPVPKHYKVSRKMEWTQTRLRETLDMTQSTFQGLLEKLDKYFENRPAEHQRTTGWAWISFEGDNDPRAKLCRELGAINFGQVFVQKVLELEPHRRPTMVGSEEIKVTGYLLYQTAMASEKRTLARAVRHKSRAHVVEEQLPLARVPLVGVARQMTWIQETQAVEEQSPPTKVSRQEPRAQEAQAAKEQLPLARVYRQKFRAQAAQAAEEQLPLARAARQMTWIQETQAVEEQSPPTKVSRQNFWAQEAQAAEEQLPLARVPLVGVARQMTWIQETQAVEERPPPTKVSRQEFRAQKAQAAEEQLPLARAARQMTWIQETQAMEEQSPPTKVCRQNFWAQEAQAAEEQPPLARVARRKAWVQETQAVEERLPLSKVSRQKQLLFARAPVQDDQWELEKAMMTIRGDVEALAWAVKLREENCQQDLRTIDSALRAYDNLPEGEFKTAISYGILEKLETFLGILERFY